MKGPMLTEKSAASEVTQHQLTFNKAGYVIKRVFQNPTATKRQMVRQLRHKL